MARIAPRTRCSSPQVTRYATASWTLSQEVRNSSAVSFQESLRRHFFDQHPALLAVDPSHAIDQKNQVAPEADELKPSRRGRLVVAGRGLMTARANRRGSFPRPDRDEDGLSVFGEAGLSVDKSWDGMTLVQDSGQAHELSGIDY